MIKTTPDPRPLGYGTYIYVRGHNTLQKGFHVVMLKLYCAHAIEIIVTKKLVFKIVLHV